MFTYLQQKRLWIPLAWNSVCVLISIYNTGLKIIKRIQIVEKRTGLRACFTYSKWSSFSLCPRSQQAKRLLCDGSCLLCKFLKVHTAGLDSSNNHIIRVVSPFPCCYLEKELSIKCCSLPLNVPFQRILATRALAFQFHTWCFHYINILGTL